MYKPEEIDYELGYENSIPESVRTPLAQALSFLPEDVIDFAIEKCFFACMDEDQLGMHMSTKDFRMNRKSDIITLPARLWSKNKKAIAFAVAHEVAHAYKKHGFRRFEDTDAAVVRRNEKAADSQAIRWLRNHFNGSFKRYTYKEWQL